MGEKWDISKSRFLSVAVIILPFWCMQLWFRWLQYLLWESMAFITTTWLYWIIHINTLEFISSVISIWIDILNNHINPNDCILSQTDSATAAGWLKKSNFLDTTSTSKFSIHLVVARKLASIVMESSTCLYAQWFLRDSNNIADALSRDHLSTNSELCASLLSLFPEQLPVGLIFLDLPEEIYSWILSLLRELANPPQLLPVYGHCKVNCDKMAQYLILQENRRQLDKHLRLD